MTVTKLLPTLAVLVLAACSTRDVINTVCARVTEFPRVLETAAAAEYRGSAAIPAIRQMMDAMSLDRAGNRASNFATKGCS